MKKKKLLKSASLIALSAVMMCGAAATFTACGDDAYTIKISMFCGDSDVDVNRQNCMDWAKKYTQELYDTGVWGEAEKEENREVKIKFSYQSDTDTYFTTLSNQISSNAQPDVFYVSPKYVKVWSRMNKIIDMSAELAKDAKNLSDIWEDSLAFYSYSKEDTYTNGDRIYFDSQSNTFKTVKNDTRVGIYGLPKDYSNFGLGFNEVFFTKDVREKLMELTTNDRDDVHGAEYAGAQLTYRGETGVVTYDPDGLEDAPLISIGKPVWYRPYNFYKFASYSEALMGGDPMATAVDYYTDGKGYCVTIPGFPGDTFEEAKEYWKDLDGGDSVDITIDNPDTEAVYDASKGYITYTYAEYSAMTWAITYYVNTYDWQGNGKGGAKVATGVKNVYGNDQYDGVLYLLPWLAGNNAQYLNESSTRAINGENATTVGHESYKMKKKDIHGAESDVDISWGINNEEFLETVGAFYAYGSDWNGNSNNAGDTTSEKSSGWDLFVAGNCVFYGVGTWNAGALNATSRETLRYRLMPEPVSEDYALASVVKDQDYKLRAYGAAKMEGEKDVVLDVDEFSAQEIVDNQIERQDKWGARMDSVGYGVSALIDKGGAWRKAAGIDLVRYLTITPETQVTLTYAGSQLPNFKGQCEDFLNHEDDFEDMVTPEDDAWDETYAAAQAMRAAVGSQGKTTVAQYMLANYPNMPYDKQYDNTELEDLIDLSYTMKILRLVAYTTSDRDLSLRMQYGLNATRDSAMYTYNDAWIDTLDARGTGFVMCYTQQAPYEKMVDILEAMFYAKDAGNGKTPNAGSSYGTPAWFYLYSAEESQKNLDAAIATETQMLGNR